MALQNMIEYLYQQAQEQIDAQKANLRAQSAKSLAELGHKLEEEQEEKIYHLEESLKKRKSMQFGEQDFIASTETLKIDNEIAEQIIYMLRPALIQYIINDMALYHKLIAKWYQAILDLDPSEALSKILVHSRDLDFVKTIVSDTKVVIADDRIELGMIAFYNESEFVDLSFETLFSEKKSNLLSQAMVMLKEKSWNK